MNSNVTIIEVAKAAGVSPSTVSRVICGKATSHRILPATQNRVLAAVRDLGYQPNQAARDLLHGKPLHSRKPQNVSLNATPQISEPNLKRRKIGILLSPVSSADTLNLIPSLIPDLMAAGYSLTIHSIPPDPASLNGQLPQILSDGITGILCCPSLYTALSNSLAGKTPVIVLWQGAGKAILNPPLAGELSGSQVVKLSSETKVAETITSKEASEPPASNLAKITNPIQDGSAGTPRPTEMQEIF